MLELAQPPPHASLLQELLLALAGHTGDVFVDDAAPPATRGSLPDPYRNTVQLAKDINWINSSEGCAAPKGLLMYFRPKHMCPGVIGGLQTRLHGHNTTSAACFGKSRAEACSGCAGRC